MITTERKRHWFRLSPDRLVIGLLLVICLFWLSDQFRWLGFNHHKGWTVLFAVAAVGVVMLLMLFWFVSGLLFHWRFQFGIRTLLTLVVVCSIACSWLVFEREKARSQAEALKWIDEEGGAAHYDWDWEGQRANPELPGPDWLQRMLGTDFFSIVVEVRLTNSRFPDDALEQLKCLTQLESLELDNTRLTDAALEHLTGLTKLQYLDLGFTPVGDVGLLHLEGLVQLRYLSLHDTDITDVGMVHLKRLAKLQTLYLDRTGITDAGLENLGGLAHLESLSLNSTKITDAGLAHLKGLTRLQELVLRGTKVTDVGIRKLQQALPNCTIYHGI